MGTRNRAGLGKLPALSILRDLVEILFFFFRCIFIFNYLWWRGEEKRERRERECMCACVHVNVCESECVC